MILLGFAHREVAKKKVKCLLFHSIIVIYQSSKKSHLEAKKPGNSNSRIKPRTGKRNSDF